MQTSEYFGKQFQVLGDGYVELQDLMPHPLTGITPDQAIVAAARVSHLGKSKGDKEDAKLIHYLVKNSHTSPLEMVRFKLRVKAPLVTFWQWTRHRTMSYMSVNSQSGRYTDFDETESMYYPGEWRLQAPEGESKQASQGVLGWDESAEFSKELRATWERGFALYKKALDRGVAREQARLYLPGFALYYTWVISVDLHNLMHFLKLRMAKEAQYEIRVYAKCIYLNYVRPLCPVASEAFEQYILGYSPT